MNFEHMDIMLRPSTSNDAPALEKLFVQLGYDIDRVEIQKKITILAGMPGAHAVVAEIEAQVVGFISLHILHWPHVINPVSRVTALVIDEKWRGKGVGSKMISHVEKLAISDGCSLMEVTSAAHRAEGGTHTFYQQLGYRNAVNETTYFRKNLVK
tara:strand:+ start:206 stop:670 length:465 start_codon:yes stop_codon:yes gene_type:complete